jgi:hypothetical protein
VYRGLWGENEIAIKEMIVSLNEFSKIEKEL